jgi:hypothetical protein
LDSFNDGAWVGLLTLLEGFKERTISECTFGVLRAPLAATVTALKTAESSWRRETTYETDAE